MRQTEIKLLLVLGASPFGFRVSVFSDDAPLASVPLSSKLARQALREIVADLVDEEIERLLPKPPNA